MKYEKELQDFLDKAGEDAIPEDQKSNWNDWIKDMKLKGTWDKIISIYPMIGNSKET